MDGRGWWASARQAGRRVTGARESREQLVVVVDPVQRGVREDQIDGLGWGPFGDVGALECQAIARVIGAVPKHR
jgi:hypothetical protein